MATPWHRKTVDEVMAELGTGPRGLSRAEADRRLFEFGPNELKEKRRKTALVMLLDQFTDFMIVVLIAASLVSATIGNIKDAIAIIVIVLINGVIGFIQEYRAEKAMAALKRMAAPGALVLREGHPEKIPALRIVPGDIVLVEAGVIVPADMRLNETARLKVQEAALTGESVPVEKETEPVALHEVPLGDRFNMLYKGTVITYGRGSGVVVATAMDTELGKIAKMLQEEEEVKTPLQKRLARFGKRLALVVLFICALVFGVGFVRGEEPVLMLLTAISLAVAAIPEALPAVVTISLALGARRMVRQNALIRKLPAVETLGSITYICSDKTGTLTLNSMTVEEVYHKGASDQLMRAMALSNDARRDAEGQVIGDPTETALYVAAKDRGFDKGSLERSFPRVAEIPFDSNRKCMTTLHSIESTADDGSGHRRPGRGFVSFTKGALDVLLPGADSILTDHGSSDVPADELQRSNEAMAAKGLRVLCVAMREWDEIPGTMTPDLVESRLTILGLVGMMDPPRAEAAEAVALCRSAGIMPVMITGDHPITARAVARRIGILEDDSDSVITGRDLEAMPFEEFERRVEGIKVYARVAPEQKLTIVKALQDKGQFVGMTGDGVNDAPALKRADIGIAMGVTGTDVAKEAAHMVLLDDNFATIVKAVREGRKIYDNIRKFIRYLLTTNSGEIWTIFLAPFLGLPVPLLPIHLLWINLVTDGLPALALSLEPAEEDVMRRPPRRPGESIFAHGLGAHAILVGLLMAVIVLSVQAWSIRTEGLHWQTMVFTLLCFTQLGHVLAIRSEKQSLFTMGLFSNSQLFGAVLLTIGLQLATIYVPLLNPIFRTEPLTFIELGITAAGSSLVFIAVELEKMVRRRSSTSGPALP